MLDEAEMSSVEVRGWARREWRLSAPPYNLPLPVYSPPLSRGSARDKEAKSVATFSFHGRLRFTMCTPPSQVAGLHIFCSAHVVFCTYFVLHIFCPGHILSCTYLVLDCTRLQMTYINVAHSHHTQQHGWQLAAT